MNYTCENNIDYISDNLNIKSRIEKLIESNYDLEIQNIIHNLNVVYVPSKKNLNIFKEIKYDIHNGHHMTKEQIDYINTNSSKSELIELLNIYDSALKRLGGWRLKNINN